MRAVSIHAPAWGATIRSTLDKAITRRFNPRARVGRDGLLRVAPAAPTGFNPRARVGRDIAKFTAREYMKEFQSTRPRGARRPVWIRFRVPFWFQSTRPRGARLWYLRYLRQSRTVSIHAPAWGATCVAARHPSCRQSFQSTRPRGARRASGFDIRANIEFQSTRPRGARLLHHAAHALGDEVSIHAPAWGATRNAQQAAAQRVRFQSTRPRGARRLRRGTANHQSHVSIHAPAWGATVRNQVARLMPISFNPRARVGRDNPSVSAQLAAYAFQSTRPRGARRSKGAKAPFFSSVSIHAPAWGATTPTQFDRRTLCLFQSTRPRGARRFSAFCAALVLRGFNPRARVGRDHQRRKPLPNRRVFQSTRPRGARQPHHNSLRDKDFFQGIREPMLPLDPKGTGQVAVTQKTNEINMLLKCEPSRESRTA